MSKPLRTCCICRRKAAKDKLTRFVFNGTGPVEDTLQVMEGRGAYSCPEENCRKRFVAAEKKWKNCFRVRS
ncbi:MAG: DUF448 domain-containing protein [Thermodesulfobacteriota bacterium]